MKSRRFALRLWSVLGFAQTSSALSAALSSPHGQLSINFQTFASPSPAVPSGRGADRATVEPRRHRP